MAQRRMFSRKITESDQFLDMPMSSQSLYFHINMQADDDGFVGNVKTIKRMIGASDDDLKLLINKQFLIPFDTGIVVIRDWKIHNYIQKDRYTETFYKHEKAMLETTNNKQYQVMDTKCIQDVSSMDTQVRLGKDRLEIDIEKDIELDKDKDIDKKPKKIKHGEFKNVLLTEQELEKLKEKYPNDYLQRIERVSGYVASTGKSYKSHYATIISWARKDEQNAPKKKVVNSDWEKQMQELME